MKRVIDHGGVRVYAPKCWSCGSGEEGSGHTKWLHLPTLAELSMYAMPRQPQGFCRRCDLDFFVARAEAWNAREPERLEARLAELRSAS